MKDAVSESVEAAVAVGVSLENLNFVVAAFCKTVCKWRFQRIKYTFFSIEIYVYAPFKRF